MAPCAAWRCCCSYLLPRAFNSDGSWPRAGEDGGTAPALQVLLYPATRLWFIHCKLNSPRLMCKLIWNKNHCGDHLCRMCYSMLCRPFLPVQFLIKRWGLRAAVPCSGLCLCRACPCRTLSPCHCCPCVSHSWYARDSCNTLLKFTLLVTSPRVCLSQWHFAPWLGVIVKPGGAPKWVNKQESWGRAWGRLSWVPQAEAGPGPPSRARSGGGARRWAPRQSPVTPCAGAAGRREKPQCGFTGEEAVPFHPDTRRCCYLRFTDWDVRHGGNVTCWRARVAKLGRKSRSSVF